VLFMSAFEIETVDRYPVRLAPGEPFLSQPFTMDELTRAVRAARVYRPPMPSSRAPLGREKRTATRMTTASLR